jgi:hypothetical protein
VTAHGSVRIPAPVNAALDWVGEHVVAPASRRPLVASGVIALAALVVAALLLPARPAAFFFLGLECIAFGSVTTWCLLYGPMLAAYAERDEARAEAKELKGTVSLQARRIEQDEDLTLVLHAIRRDGI